MPMTDIAATAEMQAALLSQALPYMQRYEGKTVVVKYGGHAMGDIGARPGLRPRHRAAQAVQASTRSSCMAAARRSPRC